MNLKVYVNKNTGYFALEKCTSDYTLAKNLKKQTPKLPDLSKEGSIFINAGGTIVSSPNFSKNVLGVTPQGLFLEDKFLKFIKLKKINYFESILKLSEDWTLKDYLIFKTHLKRFTNKRLIITHGTDNLAFFSTWVLLLAKQIGFNAIILVGQRSLDRPTAEFYQLLGPAFKVLKRIKGNNVIVCTFKSATQIALHPPLEIKKFHTTKKDAFYSQKMKVLNLSNYLKNLDLSNLKTTLKDLGIFKEHRKIETINTLAQFKKVPFTIQSLNQDNKKAFKICRGVGNCLKPKKGEELATIIGAGPLNFTLYHKKSTGCKNRSYSWESLYILKGFLK